MVEGAPDQPVRFAANSSDEESGSEDESEPRKPKDDVVMQVSSSTARGGKIRDTAIGSRAQKQTRSAKVRTNEVVGEQQVTFVPESKRKNKPQPAPAPSRRQDSRRSASTNTFRRL
jgi:ribosome biogenesis protein ENP2